LLFADAFPEMFSAVMTGLALTLRNKALPWSSLYVLGSWLAILLFLENPPPFRRSVPVVLMAISISSFAVSM